MSTEPIEVASHELERVEPGVANLVPVTGGGSLVRAAASVAQIEEAFREYQQLCTRLLDATDYQRIGSKDFRKKSGWRKLAVAFGVSCDLLDRQYERDARGRIICAEVVVRATAPNGRTMDGLGACDVTEKCCQTPCSKRTWNNHKCCEPTCDGTRHFSNASHDLPATAMTRATNRACADLFGMGEVSADEIVHDTPPEAPPDPDSWFRANGWEDMAAHDTAREEAIERAKALPDEMRAEFKAWLAAEGYGHLGKAQTLTDFTCIAHKIAEMTEQDAEARARASDTPPESPDTPQDQPETPATPEPRPTPPKPSPAERAAKAEQAAKDKAARDGVPAGPAVQERMLGEA